jgi:hypothetical protein
MSRGAYQTRLLVAIAGQMTAPSGSLKTHREMPYVGAMSSLRALV